MKMRRALKYITIVLSSLYMLLPARSHAAGAIRGVTPEQWRQLTGDKAFSYRNDIENAIPDKSQSPNFLQKALSYLFRLFSGVNGTMLLWLIVLFGVALIVYVVLSNKNAFLFQRKNKPMTTAQPGEGNDEDVVNTNWDSLLQEAVRNQDVRMAVRYSYMRLLQLFQSNGLIQYRNDKTNYDYYTELGATAYKQPFRQLSRQYEYAWYGHYSLSPDAYRDYMSLFDTVKRQLGA